VPQVGLGGREGRFGVQGQSGLLPQPVDHVDRSLDVVGRLDVHGDAVRPGIGELLDVPLRRGYHEVNIERHRGTGADGLHHRWTDSDVRHEHAVHDIDMDPVCALRFEAFDLLPQAAEVRREYGWSDLDHVPFIGYYLIRIIPARSRPPACSPAGSEPIYRK